MSIRWWQELDRYSKIPLPILMLMMSALLWNYHIKLIFYSDESMKILLTKDFRTISFENIHKLEKCFRYKHNSKFCWVDGLKKKKHRKLTKEIKLYQLYFWLCYHFGRRTRILPDSGDWLKWLFIDNKL